jgi:hypothetical protein
VQDTIRGRAPLLPFIMVVNPKVELPFDRTIKVVPLFVKDPLQVVVTCCGAVIATVTVQVGAPLTVTDVL